MFSQSYLSILLIALASFSSAAAAAAAAPDRIVDPAPGEDPYTDRRIMARETPAMEAADLVARKETDRRRGAPPPCPTTLTVPGINDCSGCTTTVFEYTLTASVDCGGCKTLVTSTSRDPFAGLCPVSCDCSDFDRGRDCEC